MLNKNNKAQEETVGFVLIILIVTVIALVFLSFSAVKRIEHKSSSETSKFLGSMMYYTTDCALNYIPQYRDVQQLIIDCYKDSNLKCLNGIYVCDSLNKTITKLIKESLRVDINSPEKAFRFILYYNPDPFEEKEELNEEKYRIEEGEFIKCS